MIFHTFLRNVAVACFAILCLGETSPAADMNYQVGAVDNLVKVRRDDSIALNTSIRLEAARNEIEPFQVIVRATVPLRGVKVAFSDLQSEKSRIDASCFRAFIQHYHRVDKASDMRAFPAGENASTVGQFWPDALLPYKPFDIEGANQGLWIELRVPADAAAGSYHGAVTLTPENAPTQTVDVQLTVWDFALPTTPSFRMTGAVQVGTDPFAAGPQGTEPWKQQWRQRTLWFLDQGISPCWLVYDAATPQEWSPFPHRPYTESFAEYLDHPNCTTVQLSFFVDDWRDPNRHAALKHSTDWIKQRWGDKIATIIRTSDEPPADTYPELRQDGITIHKIHPDLKVLLTARDISPALMDGVDFWCPFFTEIGSRIDLDLIRQRREKGEEVWFYANDFTFPVDIQGIHHRVIGWAAARYGLVGEYLFGINWWLTEKGYSNPFETLMSGANGWNGGSWIAWPAEGIGQQPGMLSSIRLAQIRQWMEDYDYFELLKSRISEVQRQLKFEDRWLADDRAWEIANAVIADAYHYNPSPENLLENRRALAKEILDTPQSPLIALAMTPRSSEVTDLNVVSIRGAVEAGARISINGNEHAVDPAGHFDISLPLVEGKNDLAITVTLGDQAKVLHRSVTYRPDSTLVETIRTGVGVAASYGIDIPPRLSAAMEYYEQKGGWGHARRRAEAKQLFETLQLDRYRVLLGKVEASSLPETVRNPALGIVQVRAQSGQYAAAADMLAELLKIKSAGPCSITPVQYEDYFGWQLDNGILRAVVLEEGARIMTLHAGDVPMLWRGLVRSLDLGELTWRDVGGYEDVLSDNLDARLAQSPWTLTIEHATADQVTLRASRDLTDRAGQNLRIVRNMTLRKGSPAMEIDYEIHNLGRQRASVSWRAHISPAVGVNTHNDGGDPENDQFVLADTAAEQGLKLSSYDSKANPGLATDMTVKIGDRFIAAFDPLARAALVVRTDAKTPYVYLWYETNDHRPYENPWKTTRNRYTFEPNNTLGSPPMPFVLPPAGIAKFAIRLYGLTDVGSAEELKKHVTEIYEP